MTGDLLGDLDDVFDSPDGGDADDRDRRKLVSKCHYVDPYTDPFLQSITYFQCSVKRSRTCKGGTIL